MSVRGMFFNSRQCHNCGKIMGLQHMFFAEDMWFCNWECYYSHKTKGDE